MIVLRTSMMAVLFAAAPAAAQELPAARVVVPWEDFQDLYARGMAPDEAPEAAPQDAVLSRAVYSGRIDGSSALLNARLTLDVLADDGWVAVRLLPTSVALRSARLGNADAPIYLDDGWYTLVTNRRGTLTLDLDFAVTVWDSSGQQGFAFALPPSGGTEVSLALPGSDALEVRVDGAQQVVEEARGEGRWLRALLPPTGNLSVSWQRKGGAVAAEQAVARVYAEHDALIGVSEGLLQCRSVVNYSILHAGVDRLAVSLPEGATVVDVRGQGVRTWGVTRRDGRQHLEVSLNFEAKGAYTLAVDYEAPLPEGADSVVIPDLQVDGVERIKGFVGVDARSSLEIAPGAVTGVTPLDVRELPTALLGQTDWPILYGFTYNKGDYRIPLQVHAHAPVDLLVTLIDQTQATTALTPDGRRMTRVVYAMRNNQAQFLRLTLPPGAIPWSTFVGGRSVKPGRADDGRVLIPLTRSQTTGGELAQFAVELVYVEEGVPAAPGAIAPFAAALPRADVPSTGVAWTVYIPRGGSVVPRTTSGSLRQVSGFTEIPVPGASSGAPADAVQAQADAQYRGEAMAQGVQPVRVSLPLDGTPMYFEKLLVLDEALTLDFQWRAPK